MKPLDPSLGQSSQQNKKQTKAVLQISAFCRTYKPPWSTLNAQGASIGLLGPHRGLLKPLDPSWATITKKTTNKRDTYLEPNCTHFAKKHFSLLLKSLVSPCKRAESAQIVFSGPNNPRTAISAQSALTEGRPATGLRAHFGLSEYLLVISTSPYKGLIRPLLAFWPKKNKKQKKAFPEISARTTLIGPL